MQGQQFDLFQTQAEFWSPEFAEVARRLQVAGGTDFDSWVRMRLAGGASVREMAKEAGVQYHATLWRWIRRRMPDVKFPESGNPKSVSDAEVAQVVAIWQGEGVSSVTHIAERTGLDAEKVCKAKKCWQRRQGKLTAELHRRVSTMPWLSSPLKRREGRAGW